MPAASSRLLLIVPIVPLVFSEYGGEITRLFPIEVGSRLLAVPDSSGLGPWVEYAVVVGWAVVVLTSPWSS